MAESLDHGFIPLDFKPGASNNVSLSFDGGRQVGLVEDQQMKGGANVRGGGINYLGFRQPIIPFGWDCFLKISYNAKEGGLGLWPQGLQLCVWVDQFLAKEKEKSSFLPFLLIFNERQKEKEASLTWPTFGEVGVGLGESFGGTFDFLGEVGGEGLVGGFFLFSKFSWRPGSRNPSLFSITNCGKFNSEPKRT